MAVRKQGIEISELLSFFATIDDLPVAEATIESPMELTPREPRALSITVLALTSFVLQTSNFQVPRHVVSIIYA